MPAPFDTPLAADLSPFDSRSAARYDDVTLQALRDDDRRLLWKPFTQMRAYEHDNPLIVDEARGCWLRDAEGRAYLDGVSSLWVNLHGHRRAEIDEAIAEQLGKVAHSTLLGPTNVPAIEAARELVAVAPSPKLTRVFYSDSGSTAVEIALKMAFQYWQQCGDPHGARRTKFVCLDDAYHGDTIGSVSVGGMELFHGIYQPLLFHTARTVGPYCYRCPVGRERPDCDLACLEVMERAFAEYEGQVAALVIEPLMQGAAGIRIYPPEVLAGAAEIARRHGALVIADEVAVGMGRTGELFACEIAGVEPDLLAVAKGLSGGYLPLAATLATEAVYEAFKGEHTQYRTFFHGHSYTGNPLACAAAVASLKLVQEDGFLPRVREAARRFAKRLAPLWDLPHVGDIRQLGLMGGVELVLDPDTKQGFDPELQVGAAVCMAAREHGVLIRPLGDVVVLMPPLSISDGEIDLLCGALYDCVERVTARFAEEMRG